MSNSTAYEKVTSRMIEALESGTIPWRRMWRNGRSPVSVHGHHYRGFNAFLLAYLGTEYTSNVWVTFRQAKKLGGSVRKGEKGTHVMLWKPVKKKDDPDGRGYLLARTYVVFNLDQCDGVPCPESLAPVEREHEPLQEAERVVAEMTDKPTIKFGNYDPCYVPLKDEVRMPKPEHFTDGNEYYSTLFHELTHSTGHESRLDRSTMRDAVRFGNTEYSKEELTAELGAAYLCNVTGVECTTTWNNSAAYLKNWLRKLKDDPKLLVQAAAHAQRAADRVLGVDRAGDEGDDEVGSERCAA